MRTILLALCDSPKAAIALTDLNINAPVSRAADCFGAMSLDAKQIGYPYPALPGIGQLANYDRYTNRNSDISCQEFYLECLKNHIYRQAKAAGVDSDTLEAAAYQVDNVGVSAFARLLGYPRFDREHTLPLQVLANLPFKIYLTISITTFLEDALRRAGKEPLTKLCRWRGPTKGPESELWQK